MKKKITATVLSQKEIAPRIFDMWIATDLAEQAKAGQFIGVYPKDRSTLLPRPISICQVSDKKDALRIVYRIAGQGTAEFSSYTEGDSVEILGTLGNGFPTEAAEGKKVFLMGGGIGIPPMLELARELPASAEKQIIVGYRDNQLFLKEDGSTGRSPRTIERYSGRRGRSNCFQNKKWQIKYPVFPFGSRTRKCGSPISRRFVTVTTFRRLSSKRAVVWIVKSRVA